MSVLFETAACNALSATALACTVACVTRVMRSPALAHALWLLVLLKLVAPPLVPIELSRRELTVGATGALSLLLPVVWVGGALALLGLAAWRHRSLRRLVRAARAAPVDVQDEAVRLARRFGLRRAPRVLVVPAHVPPMATRCHVLLPADLLPALDADARGAILAHELAHLHRRDPWLRWFEMAVVAAFWWCPVSWWARARLREAGELCCDAWALWARPGPRAYAGALLVTIDFLAGAPRVPAHASGLGSAAQLKRRFRMLLDGTTVARRLPLPIFCALLALLPFAFAQGDAPAADRSLSVSVEHESTPMPAPRGADAGDLLFIVGIEHECFPTR